MKVKKYLKKDNQPITAVQIDLELTGSPPGLLCYAKWGHEQTAKEGDWLVNSQNGHCYTINQESFAKTYSPIEGRPGQFLKTAPVYARVADKKGIVKTKEGATNFFAGDYIVSNNADLTDQYAVVPKDFLAMYDLVGD